MGLWVSAEVIAGATSNGDRGCLGAATVGVIQCSVEDLVFIRLLEVCTVDPVFTNFEFLYKTGWAEGNLFLSHESGNESRTMSVSEKELSVTRSISSI